MSQNRRWINREEIAEIHESIANNAANESGTALASGQYNKANDHLAHCTSHIVAANTIREIDSLGHFAGQVYRR